MSTPSWLGDMSPDDLQSLTGTLGGISSVPEQNAALEKQMDMAKLLREGPVQAGGTHIAPGSVYVGPNALQSAASGINQVLAMRQSQKAIDAMTANAGKLQDARSRYMDLMSRMLSQRGGGMAPTTQDMTEAGNNTADPTQQQQGGSSYA